MARNPLRAPKDRMKAAAVALAVGAAILLGASALSTLTASANVTPINAKDATTDVHPNDLRPQDCIDHNVSVTKVISGDTSDTLTGDNASDLLLASTHTLHITAGTGDDCIVGAGATDIDGGAGNNVCIGSQTVVFTNCAYEVRQ